MPPPDSQALHKLALQIEEARRFGDFTLADRLVAQFNALIGGNADKEPTSPAPPRAYDPKDPNVRAPRATHKEAHEALLGNNGAQSRASAIADYPVEVQPILERLLNEMSADVQVPRPVLEPQFVEELNSLIGRALESEPLLTKLSDAERLRSILLRHQEELLDVLRQRNT
jgi:hypothetical protein